MNDLLIVGAYINSQEGENVLYESVKRLSGLFDIALVTHTPISERIQKQVKYFIYDHRNELFVNEVSTVYWGDYPTFDYEIHPDGFRKYHSFAVYRSITNAVKLLSNEYDSLTYIEGDWWFSPEDALKLKRLKTMAIENKKLGVFFSAPEFLHTNYFYCTMDFLKNIFQFFNSKEDYIYRCQQIESHGQLENYFYKAIEFNNSFNKVIVETLLDNYFPTTQGNLNVANEKNTNNAVTYITDVLRVYGTDDIAFMYINSAKLDTVLNEYTVKLDGEYITTVYSGIFSVVLKINPKNDKFLIEIGPNKFYYDKNKILADTTKSFIKLK